MKQGIVIGLLAMVIASCSPKQKSTDSFSPSVADFSVYLHHTSNQSILALQQEEKFWMEKSPKGNEKWPYLVKLAGINSQLFDKTGDIEKIFLAEKQLKQANQQTGLKNSSLLRSLARNFITQHRFKEAHKLLNLADDIGESQSATTKMLFDVYMELGMYDSAVIKLDTIRMETFDYYIRLAKWQDHQGNLDDAIVSMEKAKTIAENQNNKGRMLWSYSNIADYYGHAGQIQDSYSYYLKTLAIDSNYTYALKGIAWIVFSNKRDSKLARKIIKDIQKKHNTPDYELFLLEIAKYEGNKELEQKHKEKYQSLLSARDYGNMYNAYNIELWADNESTATKALALALLEIENRSTPQTYDLLAWAYFKNEQSQKALKISSKYVIGKTFEPKAMYHSSEILKANGFDNEAALLKKELQDAIYELGPSMGLKINAI
ncbi:MAG: hypothetical protein COA58_04180 [Bacteroidetes bacterium]|nr:MAG: hypothetical protein COA58_04180 [Bacteroidota bacterium]